ncbi:MULTISPECIES: AMP-binding protein [unclassified Minwuia]|jgi:cyclohexanecarboxylate-CoA ligase|uniref:AMP-binding protein n=1 Tax=unclassified Minwuia TaxID=2618799 RepID=UPI0024787881|nr:MULTISPECIES: AMP-binding protein [unclassified Minwuia]
MALDPVIPAERLRQLTGAGLWGEELIVDHFDRIAAARPDAVAVVCHRAADGQRTSLTFGDLKRLSDRAARALLALGIGPGDVVAAQLPGWWHYFVLYPACARIGAAINPLMPIFRQRELRFMLGFPKTKLLVIPATFRGFDYPAMIDEIRGDLPDLAHVLVVDGPDPDSDFATVLLRDAPAGEDLPLPPRPGANDVTELMYTSGTTGEPKGVMHTPNTLLAKVRLAWELFGMTTRDVVYMGSPMAHQTGFMYACVMTLARGVKSVVQDVWDPGVAASLIAAEGCTITVAATPFLSDLVHDPAVGDFDVSSLRLFLCAGAPIPRVLLRDAAARHPNLYVMSAWGMTENGIVTATYPGDPEEKVFETDGRAIPHQAVRVVDDAGLLVPPGTEGRLQSRGPTMFVGYFNRPEAYLVDQDLWFETGDNARMDTEGYIRITGRSRDIIIRGGENVPVVEVENLLYRHPDIVDAAVIGLPDPRLGERGCAVVTLVAGASLVLADLVDWLQGHKLARNYLPERLEVIDAFPRTPSGKIQKFRLREMYLTEDENG